MTDFPKTFKRGATFSFVVKISDKVEDGYLKNWEVLAQVRRLNDTSPKGLLSTLGSRWEDPELTRRLYLFDGSTDKWPLGPVQLDVVFKNAAGFRLRSKTVNFEVVRGISS